MFPPFLGEPQCYTRGYSEADFSYLSMISHNKFWKRLRNTCSSCEQESLHNWSWKEVLLALIEKASSQIGAAGACGQNSRHSIACRMYFEFASYNSRVKRNCKHIILTVFQAGSRQLKVCTRGETVIFNPSISNGTSRGIDHSRISLLHPQAYWVSSCHPLRWAERDLRGPYRKRSS